MTTSFYITVLILMGVPLLAYYPVSRWQFPRYLLWLVAAGVFFGVEQWHSTSHPMIRMVLLCGAMLVLMKVIVYAEWRSQTGGRLPMHRWVSFSLLWAGMNPGAFQGERRKISWMADFYAGLGYLLAGLGMCVLLGYLEVYVLVAMFIGLSLFFHFGVLRITTSFWRFLGFPVRPLFRNPLASCDVRDFWSTRWNISFSQMIARAVRRPLVGCLGPEKSMFGVFLVSGVFHELVITVPVKSGYGMPTLYFLIHGIAVMIEKDTWPHWVKKFIALLLVVVPLPLLFPEKFTHEIIMPCLTFTAEVMTQIIHQ